MINNALKNQFKEEFSRLIEGQSSPALAAAITTPRSSAAIITPRSLAGESPRSSPRSVAKSS